MLRHAHRHADGARSAVAVVVNWKLPVVFCIIVVVVKLLICCAMIIVGLICMNEMMMKKLFLFLERVFHMNFENVVQNESFN